MNETIQQVVSSSLSKLQETLSADEFSAIKSEFLRMNNNEVSVSQSFSDLVKQGKITQDTANTIKTSFYNIGYTIGSPVRGATQLVRKTYEEEVSASPSLTLGEYQSEVKDYVYGCLVGLD